MARLTFKVKDINVLLTNPDETIVILTNKEDHDQISMSLTTLRNIITIIDNKWGYNE